MSVESNLTIDKLTRERDEKHVKMRSLEVQLTKARERIAELERNLQRVLACHEDETGNCFDCRRAIGIEQMTSAGPEWKKW